MRDGKGMERRWRRGGRQGNDTGQADRHNKLKNQAQKDNCDGVNETEDGKTPPGEEEGEKTKKKKN